MGGSVPIRPAQQATFTCTHAGEFTMPILLFKYHLGYHIQSLCGFPYMSRVWYCQVDCHVHLEMQLLKMQTKQTNLTPLQKKTIHCTRTANGPQPYIAARYYKIRIVATQQFAPRRMLQVWEGTKIKVNT